MAAIPFTGAIRFFSSAKKKKKKKKKIWELTAIFMQILLCEQILFCFVHQHGGIANHLYMYEERTQVLGSVVKNCTCLKLMNEMPLQFRLPYDS